MATYLIDYENVKSEGIRGVNWLSENDTVVIFYSNNADTISFEAMDMIFNSAASVRRYKIVRGGKNALDFQLSSYLGYLIHEASDSYFYIISKDNGYHYVVDFWKRTYRYDGYVYCCPSIADGYSKQRRFDSITSAADKKAAAEALQAEMIANAIIEEDTESAAEAIEAVPADTIEEATADIIEEVSADSIEAVSEITSDEVSEPVSESTEGTEPLPFIISVVSDNKVIHQVASTSETDAADTAEKVAATTAPEQEVTQGEDSNDEDSAAKPAARKRRTYKRRSSASKAVEHADKPVSETPKPETPQTTAPRKEAAAKTAATVTKNADSEKKKRTTKSKTKSPAKSASEATESSAPAVQEKSAPKKTTSTRGRKPKAKAATEAPVVNE